MAKKRRGERDIIVRACKDRRRRDYREACVFRFLRAYFPHWFTADFTADQRTIVGEILYRAKHGGDKAIAAPRGDGKTTIARGVILYGLLTGTLRFAVIASANGPDAKRVLTSIKNELEFNDELADYYPEVCDPIRRLEGAAQRKNMQTVKGRRTRVEWTEDLVILPITPGSVRRGSAEGILVARGMDSAIRGLIVRGRRPDLVLIEDPETRESAFSDILIESREEIIDRDLAFLGGQSGHIGRVALCTLQNRHCLSAKLTDPKQRPTWGGVRIAFLKRKPEKEDLWAEYTKLVQVGAETGQDKDGRVAMRFYLNRRAEMDAGAEVSNPNRYDHGTFPDGSPKEVSALQRAYNMIARAGWDAFQTEFQNDPPEEDEPQESGITATLVASRINGFRRGVLPPLTKALTATLDLSDTSSHWVATAWAEGAIGCVVDYGILEVHGIQGQVDRKTKAKAILDSLHRWRAEFQANPYRFESGEEKSIDLALIDSGDGDHTDAVYEFCRQMGKPFVPAKGRSPWSPGAPSQERVVGNHWHRSHQAAARLWLNVIDADYWKRFAHERWLTETFDDVHFMQPGSLSLFSPQENREHHTFSHHQVAEVWRREFREGKGTKEGWYVRSKNNHYLDAMALGCASGDMCGIKLLSVSRPPRKRLSLAAMAGAGRQR